VVISGLTGFPVFLSDGRGRLEELIQGEMSYKLNT
jgi:hypothetical protein